MLISDFLELLANYLKHRINLSSGLIEHHKLINAANLELFFLHLEHVERRLRAVTILARELGQLAKHLLHLLLVFVLYLGGDNVEHRDFSL